MQPNASLPHDPSARDPLKGWVYIVGAGPGDPDLLTIRGLHLIQQADVIVYDHLIVQAVLDRASASATMIYVGKRAGKHTISQDEINALLVNQATSGKAVVRLKGGDPFIYGRGGEEALYLREHDIPFEIIPGVSALSAVPAYAGIPLTNRNISAGFMVVTGYEDSTKGQSDINWAAIAQMKITLVIFMGILKIETITQSLLENGMPENTSAAIIRHGTLPNQQTLIGTLSTLSVMAKQSNIRPPGLIVIGDVVTLSKHLQWFKPNKSPLDQ